jgi:hypothetical protein
MLQRRFIPVLLVLSVCAVSARHADPSLTALQSPPSTATDEFLDAFVPQGVRVSLAPYRTTDRSLTVVLAAEIGPTVLGLPSASGGEPRRLLVTWTATDAHGSRRSGTAYDATLGLDAEARTSARRHGLRVVSELDLAPGRYQFRVVVRGARSESVTSVLDVPEFTEPLSMAGVTLSSLSAAPAVTVTSGAHSRVPLPTIPTPRRDFQVGENIAIFTEVYESRKRLEESPARGTSADPGDAGDHTTHLVLELRSDDGSIVKTIAAQPLLDRRRPGAHAFVGRLTLDVPTGRYVIRVKARANIGKPDEATRDIPLRVKPRGSANTLKPVPVPPAKRNA